MIERSVTQAEYQRRLQAAYDFILSVAQHKENGASAEVEEPDTDAPNDGGHDHQRRRQCNTDGPAGQPAMSVETEQLPLFAVQFEG